MSLQGKISKLNYFSIVNLLLLYLLDTLLLLNLILYCKKEDLKSKFLTYFSYRGILSYSLSYVAALQ